MKKTLSLVIVVLMAAALSVSAFASTCVPDDDGNIFYDVPGCNVTPVMDGVVNDGEYSEIATKRSQWSIAVADDANDDLAWALAESAKVYMSWDETYVYYASVFTAPKGFDSAWEDDPASMWYSGAIQMTFTDLASKEDDTQNRLEYGIGTTAAGTKITTVWANAEGFEYDPEAIKDNFAIGKNGNTVTFETRTPYSVFADVKGAEGTKIAGNVVYSIGEDQDYIHAQLAAGCTGEGGKNQIHDAVFTFTAAPVIELEGNATAIWDFGESDAGIKDFNQMSVTQNGDYATFTASGPDPFGYIDMNVADVNTMQWAKIRVRNTSAVKAIELFAKTDGDGHALSGPECTHLYMLPDTANWNTYIIYLPNANIYTSTNIKGSAIDAWNWQGACSQIRLDAMWNEGDGGTSDESIDIDYIAFFSSKADAEAFRAGQDNNTQVSFESGTDLPAYMNAPAAEAAPAEAAPAPAAEAAPAAAPVAAAAPAAAAPAAQTGDSSALIVLAAVAALGTAIVVAKKH